MKKVNLKIVMTMVLLLTVLAKSDEFKSATHKMMVTGTSTLHNWEAPANKLIAKSDMTLVNNQLQNVNSMYVEVEAKSITSSKESMDDKIYECIKANDFSKITFKMLKVNSLEKKGNDWVISANGTLFIGGTNQNIDMQVTAKLLPSGEIEFTGTKTIKLSQFKLERPSAMLGTIKCGDDITLTFTLTMKKSN